MFRNPYTSTHTQAYMDDTRPRYSRKATNLELAAELLDLLHELLLLEDQARRLGLRILLIACQSHVHQHHGRLQYLHDVLSVGISS